MLRFASCSIIEADNLSGCAEAVNGMKTVIRAASSGNLVTLKLTPKPMTNLMYPAITTLVAHREQLSTHAKRHALPMLHLSLHSREEEQAAACGSA